LRAAGLREGDGFSPVAGLADAPALSGIAFFEVIAAAGLGRRGGASGFGDPPRGFAGKPRDLFFAAMTLSPIGWKVRRTVFAL
jgi:hypothetical protein